MKRPPRWDRCVHHRGSEAEQFTREYFAEPQRNVLLIGGAGFDPRSTVFAEQLVAVAGNRVRGLFLREERAGTGKELAERARVNTERLLKLIPQSVIKQVDIFALDGAVIGGRAASNIVSEFDLGDATDLVIDSSSLSKGIVFPIVKFLLLTAEKNQSFNIHLFVVDDPFIDDETVAVGSDKPGMMHGFRGGLGLDENNQAARMWLPQLISRQHAILDRIHAFVEPHDVCPILPFPASNPRLPDKLVEEYADQFESSWEVDARDILYADEKDPLDLYRTILRIDEARTRVFASTGGSLIILSPIGSKALALGALMAAIERDFPVAYVEAMAYNVDFKKIDQRNNKVEELVHVWLYGEAYEKNTHA
jgi:hypothetical protein